MPSKKQETLPLMKSWIRPCQLFCIKTRPEHLNESLTFQETSLKFMLLALDLVEEPLATIGFRSDHCPVAAELECS